MKKIIYIAIASVVAMAFTACNNYDDFDFTGTVVGFDYCESSTQDFAYLVALDSPENTGVTAMMENGAVFDNVVIAYQSPRLLKNNMKITGTIYINNNYNKAHCAWHPTFLSPDSTERITLPQVVFTSLKVVKQ